MDKILCEIKRSEMIRYSVIKDKNPREIVLLRGRGCCWRKCTFCDYHLDFSSDEKSNFEFNKNILKKVTGIYGHLEVINSGSFLELGKETLVEIKKISAQKNIKIVHFECHWLYRNEIQKWREEFLKTNTILKIKTGIETFDYSYRENILKKGISEKNPKEIAKFFDECCLLFGLKGQTTQSMLKDLQIGLQCFERVCVNVFNSNNTATKPDEDVILYFKKNVMPKYIDDRRVDILMNNTDFGVGI